MGGAGFIGTRVVSGLVHAGHDPRIADKAVSQRFPEFSTESDVRDLQGVTAATINVNAIINLAAEHRDDVTPVSLYDEVNVEGARNVCRAAELNDVRKIVFTSTVAIYGFAPIGTDETGKPNPFNDYGRTKLEAESIYKEWQAKDPVNRSLVIIRPTVVFGEANRGNVYNLLRQIASGRFVMVGNGENVKSMAYVENIAAFIQYSLGSAPGVHIYNYADKPDFNMNVLVGTVYKVLGKSPSTLRLPYVAGLFLGKCFDGLAKISGKKFPISAIRVKKFCSDSMFETSLAKSGFVPPVKLQDALERTIQYEFVDRNREKQVFFTE